MTPTTTGVASAAAPATASASFVAKFNLTSTRGILPLVRIHRELERTFGTLLLRRITKLSGTFIRRRTNIEREMVMTTSKIRRSPVAASLAGAMVALLLVAPAVWAQNKPEEKPEERKPAQPARSSPAQRPAETARPAEPARSSPAQRPAETARPAEPARSAPASPSRPATPAAPASVRPTNGGNPAPKAPANPGGGGGTVGRGTTTTPGGGGPNRAPNTSVGRGPGGGGNLADRGPGGSGVGARGPYTTVTARGGGSVTRGPGGRVATVRTPNGMDVHHNLTGHTAVVREGPDHSRVVAERGDRGYVQHAYSYRGNNFAARTYFVGGRIHESFYRGYAFRGAYLDVYAPARFYGVGFYGWAYNPWAAPITFGWGWGGNPWYGYYGGFFTPYPVYASASFWLTDYLISQSLADAYQQQQAAGIALNSPIPAGQVVLTPDVKQAIADEVRAQIALETAEAQTNAQNGVPDPASSGIARMLSDNQQHAFVVGDVLDLVDPSGQACAVTEGDVLQLTQPPPADAAAVTMVVMASKGGIECRKGTAVQVALADLQNMQNHMRETLDAGLADLQAHQGGLPTPPQSALAAATPAAFTMGAPPPDQTVSSQINQQYQQGTQAEQATLSAAPAPATATITLGQTTDQVLGILGQPKSMVDLGAKKIYVYQDLKITFNNDQVSDVE